MNAYNPQFRFSCHYAQGPGARIFGFEYLSDELPSNSDDEKRMHRAERRAERKTKERRRRFEFRPVDRKESAPSTSAAFSSRSGPSCFASGQPNRRRVYSFSQRLGPCFKIRSFFFTLHVRHALFSPSDLWRYSQAISNILQYLLAIFVSRFSLNFW